MRLNLSWIITGWLLFGTLPLAQAQPVPEAPGLETLPAQPDSDFDKMFADLGLTYEQQQKLIKLLLSDRNLGDRPRKNMDRRSPGGMSMDDLPGEGRAPSRHEGGFQKKGMGHGSENHFEKILQELNLSEEQQKKLEENRAKTFDAAKKVAEEMESKRAIMREELAKPDMDINKVKQIHEELKALMSQMEDNRLNGVLEVRDILSPEQFSAFHKKIEEKMKGFKNKKDGSRGNREPEGSMQP